MKPPSLINRRNTLHPDWTEEETTMLIETWRDVESYLKTTDKESKIVGGVDHHIAEQLSRRTNRTRTASAINSIRFVLYAVTRFINRFDEMQQSCGGRLWFDLSKQERDQVNMPGRLKKTSYRITRESYTSLVKLKSVRKWTKVRRVIGSTPKKIVGREVLRLEKCNSCWSVSDVRALVRSWSLVMRQSSTSVSAFVAQSSADSATLYTPWSRSTMSSWRKMMRIAISYLFIQDFNERHSPANWFQLSDGAQNMWMDWNTLPPDFEDIDKHLFDEIHLVNSTLRNDKGGRTLKDNQKKHHKVPCTDFHIWSSPDEGKEKNEVYSTPRPTLRTESPHLLRSTQHLSQPTPITTHKGAKRNRDQHQECNALCEHMEQLQKKQFKQAIQSLRTEIDRDVRLSADVARAIFFERFGNPGQSGDATFVANLLDDQLRQVRHCFAEFQRDQFCSNDYVFDTSIDG